MFQSMENARAFAGQRQFAAASNRASAVGSPGIVAQTNEGVGLGSTALNALGGIAGKSLPPQFARFLPAGQMLMNGGLNKLLSGNVGGLMSLGGIAGIAGQFLPPWAGDAMAAGQAVQGLMSGGSLMGMMNGLVGRFLPPELQGIWSAVQQMGGLKKLISDAFPPLGKPSSASYEESNAPSSGVAPYAARVGDQHVCPMFEGPKPHIGGPILPSGCPTVLIGNFPAARVGDKATCVGPPDTISQGESTVLIGNQDAARVGDPTVHCGMIVSGWLTVWIGKSLAGTSRCIEIAAGNNSPLISGATVE